MTCNVYHMARTFNVSYFEEYTYKLTNDHKTEEEERRKKREYADINDTAD